MVSSPRIAFLDIETAPIKGWTWKMFEANVIGVEQNTFLLSFAVKWADRAKVDTYALPDYPNYRRDKTNDKALALDLWRVMDTADIIVAHNGDSFDIKKSNARFIANGLPPPSPYKSIDTLKIARKHFRFDSNKLDNLGLYLGVGRKLPNTGFHLWRGCMDGDDKCWKLMRRYNAQDVRLLEQIYLKLRSWSTSHPNLAAYSDSIYLGCPVCKSTHLQLRGFNVAKTRRTQRVHCQGCGNWFSGGTVPRPMATALAV